MTLFKRFQKTLLGAALAAAFAFAIPAAVSAHGYYPVARSHFFFLPFPPPPIPFFFPAPYYPRPYYDYDRYDRYERSHDRYDDRHHDRYDRRHDRHHERH